MTEATRDRYTDAQRMELRSYVELAGEVIAQCWPMRTFIHHNPLHGLETLPFEQAVERGTELFGGRGYLSSDEYRCFVREGRIGLKELRAVLAPLASENRLCFAGRSLSHLDVLTLSIVDGVTEDGPFAAESTAQEDAATVERVLSWLRAASAQEPASSGRVSSPDLPPEWPLDETLGIWCDRTFGTSLLETINREMVKWCSAFLDEGEVGWSMPGREQTFYRAWKSLAQHDTTLRLIGIPDASAKILALSDRSEDALLEHLATMTIPKASWESYLARHLAAMPGWVGYIKWRAQQGSHPWQEEFPIDLVKYLSVRLFYEREFVEVACRAHLGIAGGEEALRRYVDQYPVAYRLRRAWIGGQVPDSIGKEVRRLLRSKQRLDHQAWETLGRQHRDLEVDVRAQQDRRKAARSLIRLARALSIDPAVIESTPSSDLRLLLTWLDSFPASRQKPVWLQALEATHRRQVLRKLASEATATDLAATDTVAASRPLAQVVFCIDVRSEVYRRHLEHLGGYETLGLAGFFGVPLDYRPFAARHAVSHCPVLLKPKNQVREVPRSYHGALADRHKTATKLSQAARALLHDLKENVVTPYVMVEAIGWFFSLPLFGRTLLPVRYDQVKRWLMRIFMPAVATTLTVEKLARAQAEEMVAAEQQVVIRELLRERFGLSGAALSPTLLETIRKKAVGQTEDTNGDVAKALGFTPAEETVFYEELRERHRVSPRGISSRLDRLTHTGFSIVEQAYFVEAALRLMGLTSNFARAVVFCAHGSTSYNNPYESALDCGACGGNHGLPNARTIAAMANKPAVRNLLQDRGIPIPSDTQFLAAEHDTTTDRVRLIDLEDVPATHRKDLQRLMADLDEAGAQAALERAGSFPQGQPADARGARQLARRRSDDWAEVRPEWGLSKNSLIVIGRRSATQRVDMRGRAFLHSYDHRQDASGKLLETIMTAPLVVAQWINMEHYFSTVDNEVYGSGSKVYHNVTGRVGVMSGVWSDLRIGLPAQTVMNGPAPYHEPMRLLAIIEAPRERIRGIIYRHPLLEQLFNLGWVSLVALDPRDRQCYRYDRAADWIHEELDEGGQDHDQLDAASHEGNQDRCAGGSVEVCH
ncbi:MAG: DUF2309 domain-containing protein [Nitrospiraceae bacterium]